MADGVQSSNPYTYWETACVAVRKGLPLPIMTDGKPEFGFYWICKVKDGPKLPVAIFADEDETIITIDGMPILAAEHNKTWLICARHPVDYETFLARQETGQWPGLIQEAASLESGSNSGPALDETPYDILVRELESARTWIKETAIDSDVKADECANKARELQRLKSLVKEMHEIEKAPHLARSREVDDKYLPLIRDESKTQDAGRATQAIKYLFARVNDWIEKKKAAAAEQERLKKEAEDNAIAAAAAERQKQIEAQGPDTPLPPQPASPPPPPPTPAPASEKLSFGGLAGNRARQRTTHRAVFEGKTPEEISASRDKCYQHFREHPDVTEVLLKLSQAIIKAKMPPPPGIVTSEETKVQ